ncbi:MAG: CapA family protein, partial [Candidatus Nealsonbacteria bacterium]|nr:CapA family protein [Candidatus Nealsonbacteria bacterium]
MACKNVKLIFLVVFTITVVFSIAAAVFLINPNTIEIHRPQAPKQTETVKIILMGDIMLDRGVEYMIEKQGKGDFKFPFLKVADYFKKADIVFGNLEGVISDKG